MQIQSQEKVINTKKSKHVSIQTIIHIHIHFQELKGEIILVDIKLFYTAPKGQNTNENLIKFDTFDWKRLRDLKSKYGQY